MTNTPLGNTITIKYTGFGIVIPNFKDLEFLYLSGCFGKGTFSRCRPSYAESPVHTHSANSNSRQFLGLLRLKSDSWFNRIEQRKVIKSDILKVNLTTKDILNSECRDYSNRIAWKLYSLRYSNICRKESKYVLIDRDLSALSHSLIDDSFSLLIGYLVRNFTEAHHIYELNEFLHLTNEEASYLVCEKSYHILDIDHLDPIETYSIWEAFTKVNANFLSYFAAYVFFRENGWIPKCGSKFGVDFLLYRGGPDLAHSEYGVILLLFDNEKHNWRRSAQCFRWVDFTRINRLLESVVKRTLLCYIRQIHKQSPNVNNVYNEVRKSFEFSLYVIKRWKHCSY